MHRSTHTAQASVNASAKRRGSPIGLGVHLSVTAAGPATERITVAAGAPATVLATAPTYLHPSLRWLTDGSRPPTPRGSLPACAEGEETTPIRPITGRPSLAPRSSTRSPIGAPCDAPSLTGGLRAYHVPLTSPSGLGRVSRPVAQHLRQRTAEPLHLATYLLVQAYQQLQGPLQRDHTWLVEHHGPFDTSPGLTLPLLPSSRPRCCSQSQFQLTLTLPARGLRLRYPAGFAPRRYQRRTLR